MTTQQRMEAVAQKALELNLSVFHVKDGDFEMQGQFTAMAFKGRLNPDLFDEPVDSFQDLTEEQKEEFRKKEEEKLMFHSSDM